VNRLFKIFLGSPDLLPLKDLCHFVNSISYVGIPLRTISPKPPLFIATSIASAAVTEDKIAESAVTSTKLGGKSVTASKLGDVSTVIVSAATPTGDGAFIGQQWVNTNTGFEYTWTGTVWQRLHGIADIAFTEDDALQIFLEALEDKRSIVYRLLKGGE
jgi:hypothetical protein